MVYTVQNPFTDSNAPSIRSSYGSDRNGDSTPAKRKFVSYRLKGKFEQPWLEDKRVKKTQVGNWIIRGAVIAALLLAVYINYNAYTRVPKTNYCLILDDSFQEINPDVWNHEVQIGGFGNGEFEWTTTDSGNAFVDSEGLHILPTLTTNSTSITPAEITNGYTLNLTQAGGDGTCTGSTISDCAVQSNSTLRTVIPSVRSARLNTKGKKSIKYGKVEIVAKMPEGDWLWPAIWMMPESDVYGAWPASGEIDIAESRGNDINYQQGGRNWFASTLHWGPTVDTDAYWRSTTAKTLQRGDLSQGYHTYGMQWTEDYIFTYLDTPLKQILYYKFPKGKTMWQIGDFASYTANKSILADPWIQSADSNAPFDQPFYLILNVAVGGTNGWFPDGEGNKPWTNQGNSAWDFYQSLNTWFPTWGAGNAKGMTIKSVKMWQQGECS